MATRACHLMTTNLLRARAGRYARAYGRQPFRLSRDTLYQYYASWTCPRGAAWCGGVRDAVRRLEEAGVRDLIVEWEILADARYSKKRSCPVKGHGSKVSLLNHLKSFEQGPRGGGEPAPPGGLRPGAHLRQLGVHLRGDRRLRRGVLRRAAFREKEAAAQSNYHGGEQNRLIIPILKGPFSCM